MSVIDFLQGSDNLAKFFLMQARRASVLNRTAPQNFLASVPQAARVAGVVPAGDGLDFWIAVLQDSDNLAKFFLMQARRGFSWNITALQNFLASAPQAARTAAGVAA
jgi:hypothetical protein